MTALLQHMKRRNITVHGLASDLNISTSQIYQWNKKGISASNPNFKKLKEIIPEIQPRENTLKLNGEIDGRMRSGRKRKQLKLTETDIQGYQEKEFKSEIFPTIRTTSKTT